MPCQGTARANWCSRTPWRISRASLYETASSNEFQTTLVIVRGDIVGVFWHPIFHLGQRDCIRWRN